MYFNLEGFRENINPIFGVFPGMQKIPRNFAGLWEVEAKSRGDEVEADLPYSLEEIPRYGLSKTRYKK